MTLRHSETLLRALVALALGLGFIGFATHARSANAPDGHEATNVQVAATPIADAQSHAGI